MTGLIKGILLCLALVMNLTALTTLAQTASPAGSHPSAAPATPKRATSHDSIVVGAHLTPEEIEDGKINDVYQPIYHWNKQTDCEQIVKLCETQVIPMADHSKFEETRNKFLYLANRDVAACEMKFGKYREAEQRYQKMFEYIPIWPGTTDSDYPLNYRFIGAARMMQNRWEDAETALKKAIEIFDQQIDKAMHSDSEFFSNGYSKNLKMSEAEARNLLGAAYFRDGKQAEAMDELEKSYEEASQSSATPEMIQHIIENGRMAAGIMGDVAAKAKWDARTSPTKNLP